MDDVEKVAKLTVVTLGNLAKAKFKEEADEWVAKLLELADEGIDAVVEAITTTTLTSNDGVFIDDSTKPSGE